MWALSDQTRYGADLMKNLLLNCLNALDIDLLYILARSLLLLAQELLSSLFQLLHLPFVLVGFLSGCILVPKIGILVFLLENL